MELPLTRVRIKIYNGTGETIYVNGYELSDQDCQCFETDLGTFFPISARRGDHLRITIPADPTGNFSAEESLHIAVNTGAILSIIATNSLFLNLLPPTTSGPIPEPYCGE